MIYPNTTPLRIALVANACFSLASAAVLIFLPSVVGGWLGLQLPVLYIVIGCGLVLFAADLLHQATRPRMATWRALYASMADFLWVAGSVLLLVGFPGLLAATGVTLLVAVAGVVLVFGVLQLAGADRLHRAPDGRRYRHCLRVQADAPAEAMWRVIGDLGSIARYMPSLRRSELRADTPAGTHAGVGAVRECEDQQGRQWAEECTDFQPGHRLDVRFLCDEPGFPYPASEMVGGWQVRAAGEQSVVTVWWELEPKPRWLAPLLLPLMAWQVDRRFPVVVAAMAREATGQQPGTADSRGAESGGVHLLPELC